MLNVYDCGKNQRAQVIWRHTLCTVFANNGFEPMTKGSLLVWMSFLKRNWQLKLEMNVWVIYSFITRSNYPHAKLKLKVWEKPSRTARLLIQMVKSYLQAKVFFLFYLCGCVNMKWFFPKYTIHSNGVDTCQWSSLRMFVEVQISLTYFPLERCFDATSISVCGN